MHEVHQMPSNLTRGLAAAGRPNGMTFEEVTRAIQEQATVPVDQAQVRRAVDTILEDVAVLGNQIKHKSAISA